ncbi:1,4-dihydroxy-2-naphthoate polyprenyltransferase [Rhodococcus sp. BP-349]|uniref:1,4-dihydroxy-2-naphthoate polyprenyltransferase n=1 Tax=unclassified Rhodococcus (in: high G+C Gram-positive bacteria) TaxID=192944 RepID=UPI001C9B58DF|nr:MULTISPECIES: 1,4-dihydroxy-2-naphthoate polyprenyltransferase [unclassified Rhodococcus (in: high G+C Gram-positive bacteria)]MBY6539700.1 1,4-dihydroxy-2-naphthoate polyprenyltransferase [Rhodococcus sp. BP-363]MBY6543972.1 1,4-dihydroxy-2-naphthoate polyprenyltransferase [Rhodococcus sp. BP-369]MBY6563202.1 1,4-dihydroxy-2-naphthoate polyprenyltransferase [Rhodococcus sp. BP-370]MBY6577494.1 1,4-dihydroxy-2-naphthoate polyprenyltransferase [Rhodococcus sp. BP-364]MBY6586795.1 1,4-dihydro
MATASQWLEGARPRTLPNAIAPVVAAAGAAAAAGDVTWWKAPVALLVSVALIVGVNFSNDYSDGIRGTDDDRVGPIRLVGSRLATPSAVRGAAVACFALAGVAGLVLALTTAWWLVLVGVVCIAGAWYYTGGSKPYGYSGLGEIAVFVFFGLVAVLGTQFVLTDRVDLVGLACAVAMGCFSSAVLVANNIRDIPTDTEAGKLTLAVRLGDARSRGLHAALLGVPFLVSLLLLLHSPWAVLGVVAFPLAWRANAPVRTRQQGLALIPALRDSGLAMLVWAVATTVGLLLG